MCMARALHACTQVLLASLQFLFYARLRGLLGVSKSDLTLVWDVLAVLKGGAG